VVMKHNQCSLQGVCMTHRRKAETMQRHEECTNQGRRDGCMLDAWRH